MTSQLPKTLYISPAWQQHVELITHLSKFSQNILLMIAPQNGGKTSFLEHFLSLSTPTLHKKCFKAKTNTDHEALLRECTLETFTQNQTRVLFIDDSHLLSNEQLQILIDLSRGNANNQLHLVLLGEPSLELRLFSKGAACANEKVYTIELESWTQQDIKMFLAKERIYLSEEQIAILFEKSGGLPGEVINAIKVLNLNNIENKNKRPFKLRSFHPVPFGILAGLVMGSSYLLLNNNNQEEGLSIPVNAAQFSENSWPEKEISPNKSSPPVVFHFDKIDTSDVVEDESPKDKPEAFNTKEKSKDAVLKAVSLSKNKKINSQERHLLDMNKHHYTLQLLGANKESTVKQFIKKYSLEGKTYSFKTKRQGKDWYVVVYGDYPSMKAARTAVLSDVKLQEANIQPWVRDVGSIHKDINQG